MNGESRGARSPDDLTEEDYARAADSAGPEHTDVHRLGSRLVELLQGVAVLLLNLTLLGMGFVFLYRVWREIFACCSGWASCSSTECGGRPSP